MKRDVQHIRRSQYVLSLGPGSIIEGKNGPRIILSIERGLNGDFVNRERLEGFEISDTRLIKSITTLAADGRISGANTRVFRLPSNAEVGRSQNSILYFTRDFPVWRVCHGRGGSHGNKDILYNGWPDSACPGCHRTANSTAVRFVAACTNGHLDDVPWDTAVHRGSSSCGGSHFFWEANGSSLSNIRVRCPSCSANATMYEIYEMEILCTGQYPEKPQAPPERCRTKMKVVQRQATSLRIPDVVTLLSIPKYEDPLSKILQKPNIASNLQTLFDSFDYLVELSPYNDTDEGLIKLIDRAREIKSQSRETIKEYVIAHDRTKLRERLQELQHPAGDFSDFIYEELDALLHSPRYQEKNFCVGPPKPYRFACAGMDVALAVSGVNEIKTVTAQVGYRRMPVSSADIQPQQVSSGAEIGEITWYPGFEGLGEAIFITFGVGAAPDLGGRAYSEWKREETHAADYGISRLLGDMISVEEPLFVWLHTLSHLVIKALSLYTGYSAASLRERVYIDREGKSGGILIYTTSAGADASMGGLVGSADHFDTILDVVGDNLSCSNDPLCSDSRRENNLNGAACYSCLLISETSCEHGNRWLDRHIILGD
jgi:hypothetical protein